MVTLATIFNKLSSGGSKSTVLKPLFFVLCFLLTGVYVSSKLELPIIITYCFLAGIALIFLLFIIVYVVCLFKNPDLIRSEKFVIEKMAIEQRLFGDDKVKITNEPTTIIIGKPNDNSKALGGDNA